MKKRLVCLDTETTGFSNEHDRVIEIGCVDITHGWEKRTTFQRYINPNRSVPAAVVQIHGLTEEFLKQYEPFHVHIQDFIAYIEDSTLIIHNANFDISFLNAELARYGFPNLKNEIIDTLKLAKIQFPGKKVNLNALKDYFNINIEREYHGALLDSEILAQIYISMQTTQIALEIKTMQMLNNVDPCSMLFSLSESEKNVHDQIMELLK